MTSSVTTREEPQGRVRPASAPLASSIDEDADWTVASDADGAEARAERSRLYHEARRRAEVERANAMFEESYVLEYVTPSCDDASNRFLEAVGYVPCDCDGECQCVGDTADRITKRRRSR